MVEYRPVPESDVEAFRRVLDYAFRAEVGPDPDREADEPARIGDRRALYDGDDVVTTAVHLPLSVSVRDRWLDVAGLSAVATRPEDRHRGLVGRLLAESLAEYRERGQSFCLLWPFKHPFYRRFGWGRLGTHGRFELEPAALSALADHPLAGGRFEPLAVDDSAALQALDERFAAAYDLAMRRTDAWYRHRFFEGQRTDPYVYGWYRDGELRGYLRYDVDEADEERRLRVWEFGAPDPDAAVNLLRFLHRHEAQVDAVRLHAPADDRLFDLVDDPGEVELAVRPGPMGRLVDVAAGLESLPAPPGVEARVTLAVEDGLAGWNDGSFTLTAEDGDLAVEPAAEGADRDATLPVETLSRLALGATTVERAAVAGGLNADDAARADLAAVFPPRALFLREFF
ncbi:MAG: enhanced intracellular survival protein Eis [Halobacteriales archaeon]